MSSISPPSTSIAFSDMLEGNKAFYAQPDYVEATKRDFSQTTTLPATYKLNTENKIIQIAKQVLSFIIFPIAIYQLLHTLVGKIAVLPAASPCLIGYSIDQINRCRADFFQLSDILQHNEWKYKRITVEVDGYKIDAVIVGKENTLGNGRWLLKSNGNAEFYENQLSDYEGDLQKILLELKSNAILFNYPGVGASSSLPSRKAMAKAYQAILSFLEDQKKGIGAKEIIGYGHSIGGGVQGDSLKTHTLKKDIKYIFVKSRTFSDLSTEVSCLTIKLLGFLIKIFGWNMDSIESSKKLQAPEIIMQTANVQQYELLTDSSKIIDDGVIPAKASLAKALLDDTTCPRKNKLFIGMREHHNGGLNDPSFLAQKINEFLR